jgi:hypothetical protein
MVTGAADALRMNGAPMVAAVAAALATNTRRVSEVFRPVM